MTLPSLIDWPEVSLRLLADELALGVQTGLLAAEEAAQQFARAARREPTIGVVRYVKLLNYLFSQAPDYGTEPLIVNTPGAQQALDRAHCYVCELDEKPDGCPPGCPPVSGVPCH